MSHDQKPFCGRCDDTGHVSAEQYQGGSSSWCGEVSCTECPTCPCGMRLSDHRDEFTNEFLEPYRVVRAHFQAWAPVCLMEYEREARP